MHSKTKSQLPTTHLAAIQVLVVIVALAIAVRLRRLDCFDYHSIAQAIIRVCFPKSIQSKVDNPIR